MASVLLGLGANLGDRRASLTAALAAVAQFANVTQVSPVYETAPMYLTDQEPFLNMCATIRTMLAPLALLDHLKGVERQLGRTPTRRYGPRQIDIDILLHGDLSLDSPRLQIPHPRMAERGFVLVPAADIAGDWHHPETGLTISAMRDALGPCPDIRKQDTSLDSPEWVAV